MSYPINVNIPNGPNDPADDQNLIRQNFGNIFNYVSVDHIAPGASNNGYHSVVHSVPFSTGTDPSAITGIGQLYTKTVGSPTDQQLFYESGNGVVTQLSGNATTSSSTGSTTLPNGLIFKWGYTLMSSGSGSNPKFGTITFSTAFPNNLFNLQMTLQKNGTTGSENNMSVNSSTPTTLSASGFNWNFTGSTSYDGFYWFAIGN
jgi:hypothetical protein